MEKLSLQFTNYELTRIAEGNFHSDLLNRIKVFRYNLTALYVDAMVRWARETYQKELAHICLTDTFTQFSRFEELFPQETETVISYPYVGSWANATVRDHERLARSKELWSVEGALARSVAHFSCITAAIALRAQRSLGRFVPFSVVVPVVRNMIRLPTLGAIPVKRRHSFVRLTNSLQGLGYSELGSDVSFAVEVSKNFEQETPTWSPLKRVKSTVDGHTLQLYIDDIDAHAVDTREGDQADLTDPKQPGICQWQTVFNEAWEILVRRHPKQAQAAAVLLRSLAPLKALSLYQGRSATAQDALGSIMLTFPGTGQELARIIVHEIRHAVFGSIVRHVDFFHQSPQARALTRVPWRPDSRPLIALLDGVFSFAGETAFWSGEYLAQLNDQRLRRRSEFELARWTAPTLTALQQLSPPLLTPSGVLFVAAIKRQLLTMPVPAGSEPVFAAKQSEASHLLEFELRCTEPQGNWLQECVQAFADGRKAPASVRKHTAWNTVEVHSRYFNQARQDLLRIKALFPDYFDVLSADFEMASQELPGLTLADMAFALGDYVRAQKDYEQQIVTLPDSVQAWAGLGLSGYYGHKDRDLKLLQAVRLARLIYLVLRVQNKPLPTPKALVSWAIELV